MKVGGAGDQLAFPFTTPVARLDTAPRGRWLERNARLMEAAATAPKLRAACVEAARRADAHGTGDRSAGHHFEEALADVLDEDDGAIADGILAAGRAALPAARGLTITTYRGRGMADQVWAWTVDGDPAVMAVNVKQLRGASWNLSDLCSTRNLLAALCDPAVDYGSTAKGAASTDEILRLAAGQLDLLPGRDYYALKVERDGDAVGRIEARGALSRLRPAGGQPALRRHSSRDVVMMLTQGELLPAGYRIREELAWVLGQRGGDLRLVVWAQAGVGLTPQARGVLAGRLLDADPAVLAAGAVEALDAERPPQ